MYFAYTRSLNIKDLLLSLSLCRSLSLLNSSWKHSRICSDVPWTMFRRKIKRLLAICQWIALYWTVLGIWGLWIWSSLGLVGIALCDRRFDRELTWCSRNDNIVIRLDDSVTMMWHYGNKGKREMETLHLCTCKSPHLNPNKIYLIRSTIYQSNLFFNLWKIQEALYWNELVVLL